MRNKKQLFFRAVILSVLVVFIYACVIAEAGIDRFDYSDLYGTTEFDDGIIFYGDSGKDHDVHQQIVENIFAFDPLAVFHLGDAVRDGDDTKQWEAFDTIVSNLKDEVTFYPVIGNHEKGVDPNWYKNHWDMSIGQGYYSLNLLISGVLKTIPISTDGISDYTDIDQNEVSVHIAVLHSNPGFLEENSEQYQWLLQDLEQFQSIPSILIFHIPLYCAGIHYDEMGAEHPAKILYDLLDDPRFEIIACINGHDHAYERFIVKDTYHIITGCAGESPYDIYQPNQPTLKIYEAVHHISILKFDPLLNSLKFTAFDIDLNIIDSFELEL